jgi:hypothetical protein
MQIQLTVAYVEFGGNTGAGKYFYSYSPDIIKVTQKDETLDFVLSKATDSRFNIDTLVSTDANNQLQNLQLASNKKSIAVVNTNTHAQLTLVSILVKDTINDLHISCDPQVLNVPEL